MLSENMDDSRSKKNRGFQLFMKCLDEAPDVIGTVRQMAVKASGHDNRTPGDKHRRQPLSVESSIRNIKEPVKSLSGHAFNISDRFSGRPSSAPGPWTYFTLKPPTEIKGSKFTSRKEPKQESNPSPGSYFISEKSTSRYGFVPREPKNKVTQVGSKLGPGFYELAENAGKYTGTIFPKDSRELVIAKGDGVPGPGHYRTNSCDSTKGFSISKNQSRPQSPQKLGPGCYEVESVKQPIGPSFSNSLRFEMPYFEKIETYLIVAKSHNAEVSDHSILRRNLNTSMHRPSTRSEKLRKQSSQYEVKREITQKTKKAIQESVRLRRQEAIETKFRRFEIRKRFGEIQHISLSWLTFSAIIGSTYVWKRKFENKMALRNRSDKVLRWLVLFSWCIGKLNLKRKKCKVKKSMTKLKGIIFPLMRWLARRRRKLATIITESLELSITHNTAYKLMGAWHVNLIKIQRTLIMALAARRSTYNNLLIKWNKSEFTIAKKLRNQGVKSEELGAFNIPTDVKKFLIRYKLKQTVRSHRLAMTVYYLQLKVMKKKMRALMQDPDGEVGPMMELEYPTRPILSFNFNSATMKEMILKAQSLRLQWDNIILTSNVSALERELSSILDEDAYSTPVSPSRGSKHRRSDSTELDENKKRRPAKSLSKKA